MKNILFRVDALPEIGTGHFIRCIALAQQLIEIGISPFFLTKTSYNHLLEKAKFEKIDIIQINKNCNMLEDATFVKKIAEEKYAPWVILDGYNFFFLEYQMILKASGIKILCVDDLAENHFICDAIINQNLGAEKFEYSCESYTKLFLGTKYLLVENEYRNLYNWQRPIRKKAKNILVTMGGGSDRATSALLKIRDAIDFLNDPSLRVKMVFGFNLYNYSRTTRLITESCSSFEYLPFQFDILSLMKWADLVITAAGSTIWRLILTYAPMIVFILAENQGIIEDCLRNYNIAKIIGQIDKVSIDEIALNIRELIDSSESRFQYSSKCKIVVNNEFSFFDPKLLF